jgi:hypothetical protein
MEDFYRTAELKTLCNLLAGIQRVEKEKEELKIML